MHVLDIIRENSKTDAFCLGVISSFDKLNQSLGYGLNMLAEQPQDIQGRDKEIEMLYAVLERPRTPVALLLGHAGVGKTALVEQFAKELNSGSYKTQLKYKYVLLSLRVGSLASVGTAKLQSALASLLDELHTLEKRIQAAMKDTSYRIVLFIDEVHMIVTIFGPGTKIGGDVIKDVLARSPIRVIAATTRREYDSAIAVDKPLAERFKQIEMQELAPEIVKRIARNWWEKIAPDCEYPEDYVIERMIEANRMYRSDSAEPRKSLDILEDLVSHGRRTGKRAGMTELSQIFKNRYSINLQFDVDADEVYAEIERRIKGQPHALYTMKRLLRAMVYQLDPTSNKPLMTALLTGPTGVGKSLPDSTPVLTVNGFKRMGELTLSDKVFTRKGKPTSIDGVYPQGERPVYRLDFDDGSSLPVDIDHINVLTPQVYSAVKDYVKLTTRELLEINLDETALYLPLSAGPSVRLPEHSNHEVFMREATARAEKILAQSQSCIDEINWFRYWESSLTRRLFMYLSAAYHERYSHVLTAYVKNGGDVMQRKQAKVLYFTTNKTLADELFKLALYMGERVTVKQVPYTVNGAKVTAFMLLFYKNSNRKCARARLTGVTYIGQQQCTCILVNDEEHCFLAGEHLVLTHNTETVKAVAHSLYPGEPVILNINMPDYKTPEHEAAFRKRLGEHVRHTPNAIVLLDEFEKAHESVRDSMLTILDEGLITFEVMNREGVPEVNTVSLRNTIVFATTNAGSEVFANDARFSQREIRGEKGHDDELSKAEIEQLYTSLVPFLQAAGFKPEMLGRFNRIIPYRSLASDTLLAIAERTFDELKEKFHRMRDIELVYNEPRQWPPDVYDFVTTDLALYIAFIRANANDANAGGARAIRREILSTAFDSIVDAIVDNPGHKRFKVYVSHDTAIYRYGAAHSEGGVIVEPV